MEQREYWRVVLASIGDAVILTDTAGLVTYSNLGGTLFRDISLFFPVVVFKDSGCGGR
jgi:hypothetical protein